MLALRPGSTGLCRGFLLGGVRYKGGRLALRKRKDVKDLGRDPIHGERLEKLIKVNINYHGTDSLLGRIVTGTYERYIPMPAGVEEGDVFLVSRTREVTPKMLKPGNRFPLKRLPRGTMVHNIESEPNNGTAYAKASGAAAQVIDHDLETGKTIVKLPSGCLSPLTGDCLATVGTVLIRRKLPKGKAGTPAKEGRKWPQ
eukprot:scpid70885/ scgid26030/ 50S ribosomal protein L2